LHRAGAISRSTAWAIAISASFFAPVSAFAMARDALRAALPIECM
jgi:hypothetical protein